LPKPLPGTQAITKKKNKKQKKKKNFFLQRQPFLALVAAAFEDFELWSCMNSFKGVGFALSINRWLSCEICRCDRADSQMYTVTLEPTLASRSGPSLYVLYVAAVGVPLRRGRGGLKGVETHWNLRSKLSYTTLVASVNAVTSSAMKVTSKMIRALEEATQHERDKNAADPGELGAATKWLAHLIR
jgi:hypothetical protein